jgi:anti-anti-sigma factor
MTATMTPTQTTSVSRPTRVQTAVLPPRFDVHEVQDFESWVERIVPTGTVLVVDASEVRYMDRRAMDALLQARLLCMDNGGDLALAAPSTAALIILELSGRYEALNPIETVAGGHENAVVREAA